MKKKETEWTPEDQLGNKIKPGDILAINWGIQRQGFRLGVVVKSSGKLLQVNYGGSRWHSSYKSAVRIEFNDDEKKKIPFRKTFSNELYRFIVLHPNMLRAKEDEQHAWLLERQNEIHDEAKL